VVVGLVTRFGDNDGNRPAGATTVEGVSRSANSGGTGVGVHEAAVVRILTPRPSTCYLLGLQAHATEFMRCKHKSVYILPSLVDPGLSLSIFCRMWPTILLVRRQLGRECRKSAMTRLSNSVPSGVERPAGLQF
jgi:hypothetical protein